MKTPGSRSYLALSAAVGLSVSCSDAAGPDPAPNPLPDPVFIGSSVAPGPANVLSAVITVNATGFDAASVRMRTPGEPDLLSPSYAFDEDVARPAALGMLADKTYEIDVLVTANGVRNSVRPFRSSPVRYRPGCLRVGARRRLNRGF